MDAHVQSLLGNGLSTPEEARYKTIRVAEEELEIRNYIMENKGWQLTTCFRVGDDKTYLCTYKEVSTY
mgnify:CR=1 FL=1